MIKELRFPCDLKRISQALFICLMSITTPLLGVLNPADVLIVVNDDSPTSQYIGNLYRQYYPDITDNQVVHVSGLGDAAGVNSTTASEIITRSQYDLQIATPVRQHMVNQGIVDSTKVIITTAGLPYRIEDKTNGNIVYPGGSSGYASTNIFNVNAASVESELSVLFQHDAAGTAKLGINDRVVNPYQGHSAGFDSFDRDIIARSDTMNWTKPFKVGNAPPPIMEGDKVSGGGMINRNFNAGDIYITSRLDGPKVQGQSPIDAVHDMLERSKRASSAQYGVNASKAAAVFDHAPNISYLDGNYVFNLDSQAGVPHSDADFVGPIQDVNSPLYRHNMYHGYQALTGGLPSGNFDVDGMIDGHGVSVVWDYRENTRTTQADLAAGQSIIALSTHGTNGDEPRNGTIIGNNGGKYLVDGGADGGDLFDVAYGAVFASIESFNAVSMFSDNSVVTGQASLVDFLEMGGTGAVGHSFEPYSDAAIDTEFLFYNLLADIDGDNFADLSFGEAAFSALPYLSWSELVLGDPLMRIAFASGGDASLAWLQGDINLDDVVDGADIALIESITGAKFGDVAFNHLADLNNDNQIGYYDVWLANENINATRVDPSVDGAQQIPEPMTITMLLFGSLTCFRRRAITKKTNQLYDVL